MSFRYCTICQWQNLHSLIIALTLLAAGCTPLALSSAQHKLSEGQYVEANRELRQLSARTDLSSAQRREIGDDLCLSEFMIGPPSYPLAEQRRTCVAAAETPGSKSASVLAQIDARIRDNAASEVQRALDHGDLPQAELAALKYADSPGADPLMIAQWSPRIWELADHQIAPRIPDGRRNLHVTVIEIRRRYPKAVGMSSASFEQWLRTSLTDGTYPLISQDKLTGSTLSLWIPETKLSEAAFHLDKFVAINDSLIARCRCSARTRISNASNGLPAYLLYLDTDTHTSDVFVLPGAQDGQLLTAAK
jgi:hypothetical protein